MSAPAGLAWFEPIGLAELVSRAALMARVDRKYVVTVRDLKPLLAALADDALVLEIDGRREARYDSLYYDTHDLTTYLLAAHRRRRRFKVRHRTYLDSAASFVEVKTRGVRGTTVKERIAAMGDAGNRLEAGDFVADVLDRAGLDAVPAERLHPALRTVYRRSTLFLPASGSRVTLDTDLQWSIPGRPAVGVPGLAVVETKSGAGGACAADHLLWRSGHRPVRISKFGTGLAILRPDLPSTRWRPVLRRHLLPALSPTLSPIGSLSCAL